MSTRSDFLKRFGSSIRLRDIQKVPSGSAITLQITCIPGANIPAAAQALIKRHLPLATAHAALTEMTEVGASLVTVPMVEDIDTLKTDLHEAGVLVDTPAPAPLHRPL